MTQFGRNRIIAFSLDEEKPAATEPSIKPAAKADNLGSSDDDESEEAKDEAFDWLYFHDLEKGSIMFEARGPDLNFLYCKSSE